LPIVRSANRPETAAMKYSLLKLAIAVVVTIAAATAAAEDAGWKFPNLNPFAAKQPSGNPATSGWKLPRLWPQTSAGKRSAKQPSTLSKMTRGTKSFFSKTADVINPWDDKTAPQQQITGSKSIFTKQGQAARKKESNSSGVLPASWWGGEKDDGRDKSVNEFLSRPRP
jgi:hypothetical protein